MEEEELIDSTLLSQWHLSLQNGKFLIEWFPYSSFVATHFEWKEPRIHRENIEHFSHCVNISVLLLEKLKRGGMAD